MIPQGTLHETLHRNQLRMCFKVISAKLTGLQNLPVDLDNFIWLGKHTRFNENCMKCHQSSELEGFLSE